MSNFSDEVIGQSRHQFIYGENGNKRENIVDKYKQSDRQRNDHTD